MRGAETILEHPAREKDWQGDPVGDEAASIEITECQLWPVTHPDDDSQILDGWNVFVPPTSPQPNPRSEISLPDRPEPTIRWQIDGNVGAYDMRSTPKGAIFRLVRVL